MSDHLKYFTEHLPATFVYAGINVERSRLFTGVRGKQIAGRCVQTWKLSADLHFVDKVRDIVGLYLDPLANALVLTVDGKSQVQVYWIAPRDLTAAASHSGADDP